MEIASSENIRSSRPGSVAGWESSKRLSKAVAIDEANKVLSELRTEMDDRYDALSRPAPHRRDLAAQTGASCGT
jgi:hypothetical protein